jgi:glycerophosphoryl diester phosphodiesterase
MGVHDRVCVGSFDEMVLRAFRRTLARRSDRPVATSRGVASAAALVLGAGRWLQTPLRDPGAVFQLPHWRRGLPVVTRGLVDRAHGAGWHVHVWTVDDPEQAGHLLDLGVDGLITDRTDMLRDVLVARGQWYGDEPSGRP